MANILQTSCLLAFLCFQSILADCDYDDDDDCGWSYSSLWFLWFILVLGLIICCGSVGAYRRRMQMRRLRAQGGGQQICVVNAEGQVIQTQGNVSTGITMPYQINGGFTHDPTANVHYNYGVMPMGMQFGMTPVPPVDPLSPPPYTPQDKPDTAPPKYEDAIAQPPTLPSVAALQAPSSTNFSAAPSPPYVMPTTPAPDYTAPTAPLPPFTSEPAVSPSAPTDGSTGTGL